MLEQKMNERALPPEKREDLLNELAKKETEFIRLRRLRLTKNQFESIRLIGRGAFGEVILITNWNLFFKPFLLGKSDNLHQN